MTCDDEKCLPPEYVDFSFDLSKAPDAATPEIAFPAEPDKTVNRDYLLANVDLKNPISDCGDEVAADQSLWGTFLLGIFGGFLALLTPCVFPMIPLTVSFFTKSSHNARKGIMNASMYGLSILLIYVLASVPFHLLESVQPEILNNIATNPILNLIFFAIFIAFAISFFGYFEITLPSSLATKADSASSVGGILGIFFMALTLALVSFSCTGPILGGLLATTSFSPDAGANHLTMGMAGFGLALALPFSLFAMFPGWMNSLPKSGGWLNTVKVILGFLELGLAIKFLSNADLVVEAGVIKREIFVGAWIITGLGLAAYLLGWIRFPHDTPVKKIPAWRWVALGLTLAFVVYLIPGLSKNNNTANLKVFSGFLPPLFYSVYDKETKCPLDLPCFKDYEEGMAYARQVGKPVMLDFTGWACVNCRRMEENVWDDVDIFNRLNEDFVLISLYVDDRKQLPPEEQREITIQNGKKKKIRTIGDKWATFQTETFRRNSQPYYVLMSPDEKLLNRPVAYTPNVAEYKAFLDCGLAAHKSMAQK